MLPSPLTHRRYQPTCALHRDESDVELITEHKLDKCAALTIGKNTTDNSTTIYLYS